ncbi:FG-GAP repeat protein [Planctomycetota bacterium]|nr:FG-GAP repeat protein [Planctomycetota bacterium]
MLRATFVKTAISLTAITAFTVPIAHAEIKLTASDAAMSDVFGQTLDISSNLAIVGAYGNDDHGPESGSAYIFDTTTGNQVRKLTASDAAAGDNFGYSVGISGNLAIVGAHGEDYNGPESGSAYIFDMNQKGKQVHKLTATEVGADDDNFGFSVGISGSTAIIGAPQNNDHGSNSGSAYLFNANTGNEIAKLTASDAAASDKFGNVVAISGNTAIVGAPGNNDHGAFSGSAYLFDTTTESEIAKLTASDAAGLDFFGSSVAISNGIAIVGAPNNGDNGAGSGSAYLFDATTGNEITKLTASDAAAGAQFGYSVGISNGLAIVSAIHNQNNGLFTGAAYIFDINTGLEVAKLTASDGAQSDQFGAFVGIDGYTAIVGANWDDDHGNSSGSAYLYTVPEPASLALLSLGTLLLIKRRK